MSTACRHRLNWLNSKATKQSWILFPSLYRELTVKKSLVIIFKLQMNTSDAFLRPTKKLNKFVQLITTLSTVMDANLYFMSKQTKKVATIDFSSSKFSPSKYSGFRIWFQKGFEHLGGDILKLFTAILRVRVS